MAVLNEHAYPTNRSLIIVASGLSYWSAPLHGKQPPLLNYGSYVEISGNSSLSERSSDLFYFHYGTLR
jgi:hypothetical protein